MTEKATCSICGYPMPEGESMFKFHGYSGSCPKEPPPVTAKRPPTPVGWSDTDWMQHLQEIDRRKYGQTR